jgi:hypothetical protein
VGAVPVTNTWLATSSHSTSSSWVDEVSSDPAHEYSKRPVKAACCQCLSRRPKGWTLHPIGPSNAIVLLPMWIVVAGLFGLVVGAAPGWLSWLNDRPVPRAVPVGGSVCGATWVFAGGGNGPGHMTRILDRLGAGGRRSWRPPGLVRPDSPEAQVPQAATCAGSESYRSGWWSTLTGSPRQPSHSHQDSTAFTTAVPTALPAPPRIA